jgi:hypothetical protein
MTLSEVCLCGVNKIQNKREKREERDVPLDFDVADCGLLGALHLAHDLLLCISRQ